MKRRTSMAQIDQFKIEDAELVFRNFEGREGTYNIRGERNFNVILTNPSDVAALQADGWALGELKPLDEDGDPRPKLKVGVRFDVYPPNVVLITNGGMTRTRLTADTIGILDSIEMAMVDLIVRPYDWTYGDKTGTKAMLKSLYVTAKEDELEAKYGPVPIEGHAADHQEGF
jgi:hypothetical protein